MFLDNYLAYSVRPKDLLVLAVLIFAAKLVPNRVVDDAGAVFRGASMTGASCCQSTKMPVVVAAAVSPASPEGEQGAAAALAAVLGVVSLWSVGGDAVAALNEKTAQRPGGAVWS